MSNNISAIPWILDTAAVITDRPVKILRMEYIPAATGNIIQIEDRDGRISWKRTAVFDSSWDGLQVFDTPMWFNGFEVAIITAGTLYVWTE